MAVCAKADCTTNATGTNRYCDGCITAEARRIRQLANGAKRLITTWRRDYPGYRYNCGDNWVGGINYSCVGGTDNPIRGNLEAIRVLVVAEFLTASDSGQFKVRYPHDAGAILVHVEATNTM